MSEQAAPLYSLHVKLKYNLVKNTLHECFYSFLLFIFSNVLPADCQFLSFVPGTG